MKKKIEALIMITSVLMLALPLVKAFEMERPDKDFGPIDRVVANATTDGFGSVGMGVHLLRYNNDTQVVQMNVSALANTRTSIEYSNETYYGLYGWMMESWPDKDILGEYSNCGDDWGTAVTLQDGVCYKFYGGNYKQVAQDGFNCSLWICSNGYACFDGSRLNYSHADNFPNMSAPNAVIAPLWTELTVDSEARIIVMTSHVYEPMFCHNYLVVIWKNAKYRYGTQRLTFAMALDNYIYGQELYPSVKSGKIYLAYQNVTPIDNCFAFGIEDQEGIRGAGGRTWGAVLNNGIDGMNGTTLVLSQSTSNYFVKRIWLTFEDRSCPNNWGFTIHREFIRGNNVNLKQGAQANALLAFAKPIAAAVNTAVALAYKAHTATALAAVGVGTSWLIPGAGFVVSFALIAWGLYDAYTTYQYNQIEWEAIYDNASPPTPPSPYPPGWVSPAGAWVKVGANSSAVVDASLSACVDWALLPMNDLSTYHDLVVTSFVEYEEYGGSVHDVDASVHVKVYRDTNDNIDNASHLETNEYAEVLYGDDPMLWVGEQDRNDFYSLSMQKTCNYTISMIPPQTWSDNFDLFLYQPDHTLRRNSTNGAGIIDTIDWFVPDVDGLWFVEVREVGGAAFYNLTVSTRIVGDIKWDNVVDIYDAILLSGPTILTLVILTGILALTLTTTMLSIFMML